MEHRSTLLLAAALAVAMLATPGLAQPAEGSGRVADTDDHVAAAIAISQAAFDDGEAAGVVLGRDDDFADSLAGAALAGTTRPILLTAGGVDQPLSEGILDEIARVYRPGLPGGQPACIEVFGSFDVAILGGPAAVSEQAEQDLRDAGYCVVRAAGPSRVETAVAVADLALAANQAGEGTLPLVLLARTDNAADSAPGGAVAAAAGAPLLVTPTDALHPATEEWLSQHPSDEVLLLGGETALSDAVANAVSAHTQTVSRAAGAARDATAVAIADRFPGEVNGATLVNGYADNAFAYAIPSSVLAAREGAPLLYVDRDRVPEPTAAALAALAPSFAQGCGVVVLTVGPVSAVSEAVRGEAESLACGGGQPPTGEDRGTGLISFIRVAAGEDPADVPGIYVADPDGANTRLVHAGTVRGQSWSLGGQHLYFVADQPPTGGFAGPPAQLGQPRFVIDCAFDGLVLDVCEVLEILEVGGFQTASDPTGTMLAIGETGADGFPFVSLLDLDSGESTPLEPLGDFNSLPGSVVFVPPRPGVPELQELSILSVESIDGQAHVTLRTGDGFPIDSFFDISNAFAAQIGPDGKVATSYTDRLEIFDLDDYFDDPEPEFAADFGGWAAFRPDGGKVAVTPFEGGDVTIFDLDPLDGLDDPFVLTRPSGPSSSLSSIGDSLGFVGVDGIEIFSDVPPFTVRRSDNAFEPKFQLEMEIFADGFESGDVSAWSTTVD